MRHSVQVAEGLLPAVQGDLDLSQRSITDEDLEEISERRRIGIKESVLKREVAIRALKSRGLTLIKTKKEKRRGRNWLELREQTIDGLEKYIGDFTVGNLSDFKEKIPMEVMKSLPDDSAGGILLLRRTNDDPILAVRAKEFGKNYYVAFAQWE